VLDQWSEPSVVYFKVQSNEGKVYLLRYDEPEDEWTLQSGFDGDELRNSIDACSFYEARPAGLTRYGVGQNATPGFYLCAILHSFCPAYRHSLWLR